jgi:putative transposase
LRWRDAPSEYGPHKTIYNRFVRWSRLGVFSKIFAELARKAGRPGRLMIDATHLKAHRTAASLLKKGLFPDVSVARKVG